MCVCTGWVLTYSRIQGHNSPKEIDICIQTHTGIFPLHYRFLCLLFYLIMFRKRGGLIQVNAHVLCFTVEFQRVDTSFTSHTTGFHATKWSSKIAV